MLIETAYHSRYVHDIEIWMVLVPSILQAIERSIAHYKV